jgi:acetyl-CoA carboxylase carboxyl transferase alpha subunit
MKNELETEAFQRVQTARHSQRPYSMDLFSTMFDDFVEIHGDRRYADDAALVCGFARLDGLEVAVIGQQKGRDTNQRRVRNFGMPKPEGYRKALRLMKMAEKFRRPIITFIDTPGAYPGIDAEERGQAEAIAFNLREMAGLKIPIIVRRARRRRFGRRSGNRHRRQGFDDGKLGLFGYFAGRLRRHSLEGSRTSRSRRAEPSFDGG